jgi:hypothetical protein
MINHSIGSETPKNGIFSSTSMKGSLLPTG